MKSTGKRKWFSRIPPGEPFVTAANGCRYRAAEVVCEVCSRTFLSSLVALGMGVGKTCSVQCKCAKAGRTNALKNPKRAGFQHGLNPHLAKRAYNIINRALQIGTIERPANCVRCGVLTKVHGHHRDYAKPLQVEWLCGSCHSLLHLSDELAVAS